MEMFLNVGKSPEGGFCLPTTESELTIMQAKNRRLFMESWPNLTSMPTVIPAGITNYKVWTGIHLHHEKNKWRWNHEIITWS